MPFYSNFFFHKVQFHTYIDTRDEYKTKNLANNFSFQKNITIYVGVDVNYFLTYVDVDIYNVTNFERRLMPGK